MTSEYKAVWTLLFILHSMPSFLKYGVVCGVVSGVVLGVWDVVVPS